MQCVCIGLYSGGEFYGIMTLRILLLRNPVYFVFFYQLFFKVRQFVYCCLVLPQYLMLSKKIQLFQILSSPEIIHHHIPYLLRKMSIMKILSMKQERSRYFELFCSDPLGHFYSGITIIPR